MKYPVSPASLIDVTKPPYCVDNTGKVDCTDTIRQLLDDILKRNAEGIEQVRTKMMALSDNGNRNAFLGFEAGRMLDGQLMVTFPYPWPPTRILYFPKGTYLVRDTLTYTLRDLKNKYYWCPWYEAAFNIHFWGESREETVIRLQDDAPGYADGTPKAVLSFYPWTGKREAEKTNIAFHNEVRDLTVDCGKGNPDAIGITYLSSNIGRIDRVTVRSERGDCGIFFEFGSQGVFSDITVSGFDYGLDIAYSASICLTDIDLAQNRKAAIRTQNGTVNLSRVNAGSLPLFAFEKGSGCYYLADGAQEVGDTKGNFTFFAKKPEAWRAPRGIESDNPDDWAFVDDFGAVGDGQTDCTSAIQRAFNSGRKIILFGDGQYLLNGKIAVPSTVERVDFLYCDLKTGERLIGGEFTCAFEVAEESEKPVVFEHLIAGEQFYGHIHALGHAARRTVVLRDILPFTCNLYTNTVRGGTVYIENCFLTTGTYTRNYILPRPGFEPVYSHIIPCEFFGQRVFARQLNLERADLAILCEDSEVTLECFRTEGPGAALRTVGGQVQVHLFRAGIGWKDSPDPLFASESGELSVCGVLAFGFNENSVYHEIVRETKDGVTVQKYWPELLHPSEFAGLLTEWP